MTFTVTSSDCLTRNNDFYDGGSMVTDNNGGVYAAFVDVTTSSIDVWKAGRDGASFALLPSQPFYGGTPFAKNMFSHPRLRYDVFSGFIYAMALGGPAIGLPSPGGGGGDSVQTLYIDWWNGSAWSGPQVISSTALQYPIIQRGNVLGNSATLRTAGSFSFDVGRASINNDDDIRIAYTSRATGQFSSPRRYIETVRCHSDGVFIHALTCAITPEWGTFAFAGDQYSPLVVSQVGLPIAGIPSVWMMTYNSTELDPAPTGVTMSFVKSRLGVTATGLGSIYFRFFKTAMFRSVQTFGDIGATTTT